MLTPFVPTALDPPGAAKWMGKGAMKSTHFEGFFTLKLLHRGRVEGAESNMA